MKGFGLTYEQIVEVLSVYATAEQQIAAVDDSPGWHVLGTFTMPASAQLVTDVFASVTDSSLLCRVRLYDITPGFVGEVSGSRAETNATHDNQVWSGVITLEGGHIYQWQAEVVGDSGDGFFGVVRRATLDGVQS
jgi:hypothetical protein